MELLTDPRMQAVAGLLRTLPDALVRRLEEALATARGGSAAMAAVADLVDAEQTRRAAAALALAPLRGLLDGAVGRLTFPPQTRAWFWTDVEAAAPALAARACVEILKLRRDDATPALFDELCLEAARQASTGVGALADGLREQAGLFGQALTLAPVLRAAQPQLSSWLGRGGGEAGARLAYGDATDAVAGGGALFVSILAGELPSPERVLRLIAAVTDRPSDKLLAASELAPFGDDLLASVDQKIAVVGAFNVDAGTDAGTDAGAAVAAACVTLTAFASEIQLSRDGPWAVRVAKQKRALAAGVEQRLLALEAAVETAFPLEAVRVAKRLVKGAPCLAKAPDANSVRRVEALAAFLAGTRGPAAHGGFGATRARVLEALGARMAQYVEDLLEVAHKDADAEPRARAYLDAAVALIGIIEGERAADVVRRRAAAA